MFIKEKNAYVTFCYASTVMKDLASAFAMNDEINISSCGGLVERNVWSLTTTMKKIPTVLGIILRAVTDLTECQVLLVSTDTT